MEPNEEKRRIKQERLDCFNITKYPPFKAPHRDVSYTGDIYFLATDRCEEDCNGNGVCSASRCTCMNGWHGDACDKRNCPNSLCYVDIDTLEIQYCSHCSQNGLCNVETSTCECQDADGNPNDFYGKDCSIRGCKNNCGNEPGMTPIGECIQDFPFAYCKCFEEQKRGGDDCSKIFCLNDCANHGECNEEGICECEETFYGEDCSLMILDIMTASKYFTRK